MTKPNIDLIKGGLVFEKKTSHSGLELDWWWDLDRLTHQQWDILAESMYDLSEDGIRRGIAGIATGGSNLAYCSQWRSRGTISIFKNGNCQIGHAISDWEMYLWDDVVTTGQSMLDAEEALAKHGIEVVQRVCVLDRREEFYSVPCSNCHGEGGGFDDDGVWTCTSCDATGTNNKAVALEIASLFTTSDLAEAGLIPIEGGVK